VAEMNEEIVYMIVAEPNAGEVIIEGVIAIENGLSIDAIANTVHLHPSLSESVM
jgi:dihydrolipoamide dehydrogenase